MKKATIGRILGLIGEYRAPLAFSALLAVANVFCTLLAPTVIGMAVDNMAGRGAVHFHAVFTLLAVLAALYLGGSLFLWLLTLLTNRISYQTVNVLRRRLFEKINRLPLRFYDRNPHGDTISRFINDADIVSDALLQSLLAFLTGAVTILGAILFMLRIHPVITLAVVLSAPAAYLLARFITRRSQKLFREQARSLGKLNGYAEEMIEGLKVVKAFQYEQRAKETFRSINRDLYRSGVRSQFISSLSNPSARLVNNMTFAVIGVLGSFFALTGRITVGDISSFLIYSTLFAKPFNDITNVLTQIQAGIASAQRIFHILDLEEEPAVRPAGGKAALPSGNGRITFKNVRFSYDPEKELIRGLSLDVAPGSRIAIVGHTGVGKTTLVNLLMRFYDVRGGSIEIDGININSIPRDVLRAHFGMVLQDTWLFEGTIRDNIAYARPDAPMEQIISAAKAAGAHSFIRRLPDGYGTVIGDSGGTLSQGQRQLLTIARVMLADPPILILDEATSSIDTYTEMRIQQAFAKMTAGRTSFVIAHRLSTVRSADLILVMENGSIVEKGTHEQLLRRGGAYAHLYESQFAPPEPLSAPPQG